MSVSPLLVQAMRMRSVGSARSSEFGVEGQAIKLEAQHADMIDNRRHGVTLLPPKLPQIHWIVSVRDLGRGGGLW